MLKLYNPLISIDSTYSRDEFNLFHYFDYLKKNNHFHDYSFFYFYLNRAVTPPSSGMIIPVIHDDESSARNKIAFATSSGVPLRPMG